MLRAIFLIFMGIFALYSNEAICSQLNENIIDLSHEIHTNIPKLHSDSFNMIVTDDYPETDWRVQKITSYLGTGTHIDAPAHRFVGSKTIEQIGLDKLIAPCVVINLSAKNMPANYMVTVDDILDFENRHGHIADNSIVIIYTGWAKYWETESDKYYNNGNFPTITPEAAELLLSRKILALGIDTFSADSLSDDYHHAYPVHRLVLGQGKYLIENIAATAGQLPATGTKLIVAPLKVKGGTEAPARLIAIYQS